MHTTPLSALVHTVLHSRIELRLASQVVNDRRRVRATLVTPLGNVLPGPFAAAPEQAILKALIAGVHDADRLQVALLERGHLPGGGPLPSLGGMPWPPFHAPMAPEAPAAAPSTPAEAALMSFLGGDPAVVAMAVGQIGAVLTAAPPAMVRSMVSDQTIGAANHFFASLCEALVERGILVRVSDGWALATDPTAYGPAGDVKEPGVHEHEAQESAAPVGDAPEGATEVDAEEGDHGSDG